MRTTELDRPARWSETGTWRFVRADADPRPSPRRRRGVRRSTTGSASTRSARSGCRVRLGRVGATAVRGRDLRRAASRLSTTDVTEARVRDVQPRHPARGQRQEVPRPRGDRLPGDRPAADLRRGRRGRQHGGQPAGRARHPARRQGRAELPQPAVLLARLLRHPQGRRAPSCRSTCCSRAARSPTTSTTPTRRPTSASRAPPELPIGQEGYAGFQEAEGCEHFFVITADLDGRVADRGHRDVRRRRSAGRPPTFDTVADRRGRHRGHPLHLRHHRAAQGRRAAAPQHARQRAAGRVALRRRRRTTPTRYLCVLPLFHSFGQTVHPERRRSRTAAPS